MRQLTAYLLMLCMGMPAGLAQTTTQSSTSRLPAAAATDTSGRKQSRDDELSTTFRVAVELIQIDVRVVDRSGKPISGLKPQQFTVWEDGKPQKISSFDFYDIEKIERASPGGEPPVTIRLGSIAPPEGVERQARDHRLIVLFFDLTTMQPDDLLRAQRGAERYLNEQMSPADLVALVAFGNQLHIRVPFTNDRERLLGGVRALRPGKEFQLTDMAEAAPQPGEESVSEETGAAFTPDDTEFNIFNTDRKLAALESLSKLLREIPGRKLVVHFTGGITQTGEENRLQLQAATNAANRANVSFYTVDARGLFPQVPGGEARSGSSSGSAQFTGEGKATAAHESSRAMFTGAAVFHQTAMRHASRETLATLANDTGGRPFFDLGDFRQVFRKIQSENSGYYLLGYYSSNKIRDGRWRSVRVRLDVPGARVQYREGYYAPKSYNSEDKDQQLVQALRTESPRVDFPIALETPYFRVDDKNVFVPIAAKLGDKALQWAIKRGRPEVTVDFATELRETRSNRVVAALRDTITVRVGRDQIQNLKQRDILYQGGLVLGPGKYRLKFVARENETGRIGMFEQDVVLPARQPEKLELSSMLLSSQLEPVRSVVQLKKRTLGPVAKLGKTPTEISGERLVPNVTRVFATNQNLYVLFQAYPPVAVNPLTLKAGLVFFRDGQWWSETPLVAPVEADAKGLSSTFRVSLPLAKFSPGEYSVQAVVVEEGTDQVAFGQSFFVLRLATKDNLQ